MVENNNYNNNQANQQEIPVPPVPPPYHPAPPAQPVRRIGTFTLGMSLVLLCILVPLALYFGRGAWQLLLLSPAVLLCLGIEILVYAIRFKNSKYRYDGLSVFLVVMITFVTLLGSGAVKAAKSFSFYTEQVVEAEDYAVKAAEAVLEVSGCTGDVGGYHLQYGEEYINAFFDGKREIEPRIRISIDFYTIKGSKNPDREDIIQAMVDAAKACGKQKSITELSLSIISDNKAYHAFLRGSAIASTNIADIESRLDGHELTKASDNI